VHKCPVDNPLVEARRADPQSVVHPTKAFRRSSGVSRLWKAIANVSPIATVQMAEIQRCGEGVGRLQRDGSRGEGLSRSVVTHAAHNTSFTRRGPAGRWPPRAVKAVSVKGGGNPFAALAVGSRGFVKQ
jgi:hypothetical protein